MALRMMRLASGGAPAQNEMTRMSPRRPLRQPRRNWRQ